FANAYAVIDIDFDTHKAQFHLRTWQPRRQTFDAGVDGAEGGVVDLPLPVPAGKALQTIAHEDVTRSLVHLVQRTSVVADLIADVRYTTVGELVVPPRLYA